MRRHGFAGRTVTLKIKYAGFRTVTRQMRLAARTSSTESLYEAGCALLDALSLEEPVRLIGLGISGFDNEKPIQLSLMDAMPGGESAAETERRRASLDGALDELRRRYGGAAGSSRGMRLNARGRKAAFRTCLSGTGKIDRRRLRRRGGPWAGKQSCVLSCLLRGHFPFLKLEILQVRSNPPNQSENSAASRASSASIHSKNAPTRGVRLASSGQAAT